MLAASSVRILLASTLAAGCLPGAFDDLDRGQGRADMDAAMDAALEDGGADASAEDAAADVNDASPPAVDAGAQTLSITLTNDTDDALFRIVSGELDEKLHFSPDEGAAGYTIEVGVDGEQCRTGLRFTLPIEPGAEVESAVITLRRVGPESNVSDSATMRVQVFESPAVPPFDEQHQHDTPVQHATGILWPTSVGGWPVGLTGASTESPELAALVQHVVDGASWQAGSVVTFLIFPDAMTGNEYAQFRDSYAAEYPPVLTLRYR
jgi:hypothetical protein